MTFGQLNLAWSTIPKIAEKEEVSPAEVRKEIVATIDDGWRNKNLETQIMTDSFLIHS